MGMEGRENERRGGEERAERGEGRERRVGNVGGGKGREPRTCSEVHIAILVTELS